ncbi:MAG: ABC transporter C-terminal domain-containing protein, partial [Candidatus Devosia euplotis]|nr:ABC transporter C-terminal domain-containing protein [Candidatus Devosia euplotis]
SADKVHRPGKASMALIAAATPGAKRKMSFKEKHALETLPKQIEELENQIAAINAALVYPDLYNRDPNDFAQKSRELIAAEAKRAQAEERWMELELLREELEG